MSGLAWWLIAFNLIRYLAVAGGVHLLTQRDMEPLLEARRLGKRASLRQARRDLLTGLMSSVIFALLGPFVDWLDAHGLVVKTSAAWVRSPAWSVISLVLMLLVQDAWFYWSHRLMHTKLLFKRVHLTHHRSADPTALSAFSFSPAEALIQAMPCVLVVVLVPAATWVTVVFLMLTFLMSVIGHMGVELMPAWLVQSGFGRVINTTTHHHMHHRSAQHNFGLYLRFWDRAFGTEHPEYEATVARTTAPERSPASGRSALELQTELR